MLRGVTWDLRKHLRNVPETAKTVLWVAAHIMVIAGFVYGFGFYPDGPTMLITRLLCGLMWAVGPALAIGGTVLMLMVLGMAAVYATALGVAVGVAYGIYWVLTLRW